MANTREAVRRHNNPLAWVMLAFLIWYTYPALFDKEVEHEQPTTASE